MRKPRIEYPGALFHVIARGNQRQKVFLDDGDHAWYLKLLGEYLEGREFNLYAYCLMSNHVHLLIEQRGVYPLSKYMQRLQSAYTGFFNRKHHLVGHLFQGRYKAILVDKDAYLLELVRYIHLNPHRAHMENAVSYPWTSHRQYLGKDRVPVARVQTGEVLTMFSKVKAVARRKYQRYLEERRAAGHCDRFYDLRLGVVLGGDEFEEEVKERSGEKNETALRLKGDLAGLWGAIKRREGLTEEPTGWRRSRLLAEAAYLAIEGFGMRQKQVADHFGVDPTAVNKALRRQEERWTKGIGSKEKLLGWAKGI